MFTTLNEVLNYIECKTNFQLGLLRVEDFLMRANIAFHQLKYVHIGGTNGKGSSSFYLSNILVESGYNVGFFSSPSIEWHNDRIRINNVFISDQAIIDFVNEYYQIIEDTQVTMFEIDVLMALDYFVKNKVDIAIIEVGMGGRYDGTNVINPLVSVITNVGMDHTAYLGNSIEEIAYTKAGIIKDNVDLITAETNDVVLNVIKNEALIHHSQVIEVKNTQVISSNPIVFNYGQYQNVALKTSALYQVKNASLVLEVVDILKSKFGFKISKECIYNTFSSVTWNGRFEKISDNPLIIVDGAHNYEGITNLCDSLKVFEQSKIIMFAALEDKDTDNMIELLDNTASRVILTQFDFYRTKKADDLNFDMKHEVAYNYQSFLDEYLKIDHSDEMLVITGSLYFISEVRKYLINALK